MRLGAFEVVSRSPEPDFGRYQTKALLPQGELRVYPQTPIYASVPRSESIPSYRLLVCQDTDFEPLESLPNTNVKRTIAVPIIDVKDEELIKPCPFCGKRTFLDGGCNYMKCSESDPPSTCPGEWCFLCERPKYRLIPGKDWLGCCNESSHNSH